MRDVGTVRRESVVGEAASGKPRAASEALRSSATATESVARAKEGGKTQAAYLGRVGYAEALWLQEDRVAARLRGEVGDILYLLEHPHVVTLGRGADERHLLWDDPERRRRGVELHRTGRGGDVTYHGPGQLVGYPILLLPPDRRDAHRYLRDLEEVLIRTLGHFGVTGSRKTGRTGVWVGERKIASIGVRLTRWVTSHGFALNVGTALSYFDAIVPCGIHDCRMTSMENELRRSMDRNEVAAETAKAFAGVFSI